MLKLNSNYSDYTDETDVNYPEGKAVNASSSESYDGTPLLAEFMNDVNAAHIAMYEKAYGSRDGISGQADTQKASQFADAVAKYTDDKVKAHADERGLADGVHGATSEATPGQIVSRDEFGRAKFGAPVDDTDAARKVDVDTVQGNLEELANSLETAAGKSAGSAQGNVPLVGTDLGTTDNNVVLTNASGGLKPAGITYRNMMSASNAGALCSTRKTTQAKAVTLPGFALYAGVTVKVMFTNGNSADNPTLSVNGTRAKPIKVVKAGAKVVPVTHTGYWRGSTTTSVEMWQPYTILEFMYDGTDWVIVGNPTVESYSSDTASYEVKADGLIEQWGANRTATNKNLVSLPVAYKDTNYFINWNVMSTASDDDHGDMIDHYVKQDATLTVSGFSGNASNIIFGYWYTRGF